MGGAMAEVGYGRAALPVLFAGDVVVVGGSFAGVAAAVALARAGRRVALIEPRTYLGREVTATLRPWLAPGAAAGAPLPEAVRACLGPAALAAAERGDETPLVPDDVKRGLEDLLLGAGVYLLYATLPVGLCLAGDALRGLVVGNKSGRQVLAGAAVVDATATALVARLAGAPFADPAGRVARYRRTLEFDHVGPLAGDTLTPGETVAGLDPVLRLHRGHRGPDHILVECALDLPFEDGPDAAMRREIVARDRTMRLAAALIARVPAFAGARLGAASYELDGPRTTVGPWAVGRGPWAIAGATDTANGLRPTPHDLAGPLPGLWCLSEAVCARPGEAALFREPVAAARLGEALAAGLIAAGEAQGDDAAGDAGASGADAPAGAGAALTVREPESPQRGRRYARRTVPATAVPVLRRADVLVVGGGTSGATAAIVAAREGLRTALVDLNPGLGGTGTLGGVDSYWFGRRGGFNEEVAALVADVHRDLHHEGPYKWNIEGKMYALLRAADAAGVAILWDAIAIGAALDGDRVRGAVVATRWGPVALLGEVVIDATGDGDVAAFAGAPAVYGAARDHVVMWYSLAQFAAPGRTRNNFTSMVDVTNVEDYTRAILAGRRRGGDLHDHGVYVAPRETRHILGDTVMTLTDQLVRRRWPDVVNVHYSNHDVKGKSEAPWLQLGLIPPNLEIEVPYRLLLPRGLDGILVAGKAVSATHDALPAIRMQADLENLGGVVALAAAEALREGKSPRDIDLRALQRRLVDEEILPPSVLDRELAPREHTDAELTALVDGLTADEPLYTYSDMPMGAVYEGTIPFVEVCTAGPRIVPHLERALAAAPGPRRLLLAQALATYGDPAAVPVLLDAITPALAGDRLPARDSRIPHAGYPPDQGAMPDVVYLLYSLGMTRDPRAIPVWARVADLLRPTEADFRDRVTGTFYYVDAVCYGAERLGDPAAIPALARLHAYAPLRDQVDHAGVQPDFFLERQALLELAIGRALARCGGAEGLRILAAYLDDRRALLAEQAHEELRAITGRDFGKDAAAWGDWIARHGDRLAPRPVRGDLADEYRGPILRVGSRE
ncbi:MAG TPA: FAD-dependent oxidoreductase [Thermomicrobiales bacterium]|nr:FAD-dependent oxidoreductase [Thermomicrobiales bacterium]